MNIGDISRMASFDIAKFLSNGKAKEPETPAPAIASVAAPAFNLPFSGPDWNKIPTKSEPKMSEAEFEAAIRELAVKEASQGILAGTEEKSRLRRDYISVVSPDRKAIYAAGPAKGGNTFLDAEGNKAFHYNKMSNMWFYQSTDAEKERAAKFLDIYTRAFSEYEAEHGEVVGNPQVTRFNAYG